MSGLVLGCFGFTLTGARAAEEKIKSEDLPREVFHSVYDRFPGLTFTSITKEIGDKGGIVYDIELKHKSRKFETDVKGDGTMLEIEKEVFKNDWPKSLRATVDEKYPKSSVQEVLEVNKVSGRKEIPDHLEVTVKTASNKSAEILLSLDGTKVVSESQGAATQPEVKAGASESGEEDMKPNDLPRSIKDAIDRRFKHSTIASAEKGNEGGKPIYEVSIKSEGHNIDVTLNPEGEILSFEKALLVSERPKRMMQTLDDKYPHATIKLVEEVWEGDKRTGYEATIIGADKKTMELDFDADGKLIQKAG